MASLLSFICLIKAVRLYDSFICWNLHLVVLSVRNIAYISVAYIHFSCEWSILNLLFSRHLFLFIRLTSISGHIQVLLLGHLMIRIFYAKDVDKKVLTTQWNCDMMLNCSSAFTFMDCIFIFTNTLWEHIWTEPNILLSIE